MIKNPKVINNKNFPSDKEIEEITEKVSAPNYPYKNYVLPKSANSTERAKYELCQDILKYQQENKLSETKLTKMLGVSKDKLIDILFGKVYNLNLEELIDYTNNLHIPFEIKITNNQNQLNIRNN